MQILRSTLATVAFALLGAQTSIEAVNVQFKNGCNFPVSLFTRQGGKMTDDSEEIPQGGSCSKQIGKGYEGHFRHGKDDAATLVEFSTVGKMDFVWYDISIIPPRLNKGFEFCESLELCKANSQSKKGFNVPVQMIPVYDGKNEPRCRELNCLADGCQDAYNFPKDDNKTHACPFQTTNFVVTFCPSGGNPPAPADKPTEGPKPSPSMSIVTPAPSPSQTTVAPTPKPSDVTKAPVTQAPLPTTPAPTTATPTQPPVTTAPPKPDQNKPKPGKHCK